MKKVVLSICIPTYNRAAQLEKSLIKITSQKIFNDSDDIEIVISDNASTDNTQDMVKKYVNQFPRKIRYHRNHENLADENFWIALSLGTGEYLKLQNDTVLLTDHTLPILLKEISRYQTEKPLLYFRNQMPNPTMQTDCHSVGELLSEVSFFITWCAEFGIWKTDFDQLDNFSRARDTKLIQTDVTLRVMSMKKSAVVIRNYFFDILPKTTQGGYCPAKIFGTEFFSLLKPYLDAGEISDAVYCCLKKDILLHNILTAYLIVNPSFRFTKRGYIRYLYPIYKYEPYYYLSIPLVILAACITIFVNGGILLYRLFTHQPRTGFSDLFYHLRWC